MNARTLLRTTGLVALGLFVCVGMVRPEDSFLSDSQSLFNFSDMNPGDSAPAEEGVKPILRGPIHEAYASLATINPQGGLVAPKEPPAPIKETPPVDKPAGASVQWIPGYWAWDDESNNFLWVSGLWRTPPPDRQWVPGHWQKVEDGWQWMSGLWNPTDQAEVKVLPPPPEPKDEDPSTPPSEDSLFAPGCWIYQDGNYQWRDGFWYKADPDWVLVPAHYIRTTAGYVFIDQYWDFSLRNRGLLFTPVQIDENVLADQDWTYQPSQVVDDLCLQGALFARPGNGWYYFGDYFDPKYDALGFRSWFHHGSSLRAHGHAYDPLLQWYRFRNRKDVNWETQLKRLYTGRRKNTVARPPQDLRQQANLIRSLKDGKAQANSPQVRFGIVSASLPKVRDAKVVPVQTLDKERHLEVRKAAEKLQAAGEQRGKLETNLVKGEKAPLKANANPQSLKLDFAKGPAVEGNASRQPPGQVTVRATTPQLQKQKEEQKQLALRQVDQRRQEEKALLDRVQRPAQGQREAGPRAQEQPRGAPGQQPRAQGQQPRPQEQQPRGAPGQQPRAQGQQPQPQGQQPRAQGQQPRAQGQQPRPQEQQPRGAPGQQPRAQGQQPQPQGQQPRAQGQQPRAQGQPPPAQGQQPRAQGQQPRPQGQQPRVQGQQPRGAPGQPPRAQGQQPRPQGQQPRAQGQQPRAQGQQPRAQGQQPRPQGQQPRVQGQQPRGAPGQQPRVQGQQPRAQGQPRAPQPIQRPRPQPARLQAQPRPQPVQPRAQVQRPQPRPQPARPQPQVRPRPQPAQPRPQVRPSPRPSRPVASRPRRR